VISLDIRCSLAVSPAPRSVRRTIHSRLPLPPVTRLAHLQRGAEPRSCRAPLCCIGHHPCRSSNFRRVAWSRERPAQSRGLARGNHPVCASPLTGKLQQHRASVGVDFRALIRRGVRSRSRVLPHDQADALLTFSPPRCTSSTVGLAPSPRPLPVKD
jgi:hypothetical protein